MNSGIADFCWKSDDLDENNNLIERYTNYLKLSDPGTINRLVLHQKTSSVNRKLENTRNMRNTRNTRKLAFLARLAKSLSRGVPTRDFQHSHSLGTSVMPL